MSNKQSTFVIAEAGVNHNGSLDLALRLVDAAKVSGADAVKFQTFRAEALVTQHAGKAAYQQRNVPENRSQLEMLRGLELSKEDFEKIQRHCESQGIEFLSSAFDEHSIRFLDALGMRCFKVPSGEVTNLPLLECIGALGKPVILSTGMCWLSEVEKALRILDEAGAGEVTLLHCVTEYPAPHEEVNLAAMATLRNAFGRQVGYSDHTAGIDIPVAAVALGASVLEKHFTLDTRMEGPDHAASLAPNDFRHMVESLRNVERALGDGRKRPAPCELANRQVVRRSITTQRAISAGETISRDLLVLKRPGNGLSAACLPLVEGRRARINLEADELLDWGDLS